MSEPGPSVTHTLGAAGACPEITVNGKLWRIGHPTQQAKAVLEQLAAVNAFTEVRQLKSVLPADAYAEVFRELTESVAAGSYKSWGAGWQRVVWGPQTAHLFLLSLLREHHPTATEADAKALAAAAPEEVTLALAQVIPNFVNLLLQDRTDIPTEQREQAVGMVLAALEKVTGPTPTPPVPTPPMAAPSSPSGAKPLRKNPGATTRAKSPA